MVSDGTSFPFRQGFGGWPPGVLERLYILRDALDQGSNRFQNVTERLPQGGDGTASDKQSTGKKVKYTFKLKSLAKCTGKTCTACNNKDHDPDPVSPTLRRLWAQYKKNPGANSQDVTEEMVQAFLETDGATCWYCFRTVRNLRQPFAKAQRVEGFSRNQTQVVSLMFSASK